MTPTTHPVTPTATATAEPVSDFERELTLMRVTHIQHPGPRGGRPRERAMILDNAGIHALLDTLPPADRLRFEDGRELACRGTRPGDTVDALMPVVTPEAVHVEFTRRQNRAFLDDLEQVRRAAVETHTATLKNQADQLKSMGAVFDTMQAFMERTTETMERVASHAAAAEADGALGQVMKDLGGMPGILQALQGLKALKG